MDPVNLPVNAKIIFTEKLFDWFSISRKLPKKNHNE